MSYIEFPLPLQGVNEALPVVNEPGATSGYISNVRPRDVLERRLRIGQRPGLKKAYAQQIGGTTTPITWLDSVTSVSIISGGSINNVTGHDSQFEVTGANWWSQLFTTSGSIVCDSVRLKVYREGSPGTLTVSIQGVTSGTPKPDGSDISGFSGTYNANTLTTDTGGEWITVSFTGGTLSKGTQYAIVARVTGGDTSNSVHWLYDSTGTYTGGSIWGSTNSGSTWQSNYADADFMFEIEANVLDSNYTKRLIAIGGNEVWYESSAGTMTELSAANGTLDTTVQLSAIEAYQKLFIVNQSNLKVFDFGNSKISTADAGANPCTRGMLLTGGTSGATMTVDYVDGVTDDAAANIYGPNTSIYTFASGETVTGTNSSGNAVSFVLNAAENTGPHWYNWTVFGNDTATYGTMPTVSSLVSLYRGRLVINDILKPHAWYMTRVGNPFKILYDYATDGETSAVTYTNTLVGEIGDIIVAFIPYKDDLLIFGCANSIWVLIGDPMASGQLAQITNATGIYGSRAWCIDNQKNLYFLGNDGIYRMPVGETSTPPVNISKNILPNLISDLDLDKSLHRVTLSFDPNDYGIIISKTAFSDGTNTNYFFSLLTGGFFPETYPTSCGVFSSYYYPATDGTYQKFLIGCQDGYIREFNNATKNDATTSSTSAISSYCTIVQQLGQDEFTNGLLKEFSGVLSGGASSGDFTDSDAVSWELHTGNDAETALENVKDGATAFASGTWSTVGKQNKSRPRMRGCYAGIKLYNSTASQTWSLEKLYGDVIPKGKI